MISTLYDDSIEGRRHAVQLADTLGQLTDQEHEDASFDISTEHEDFDQFRKDTYGQDDEPKYTGADKAKKMRRDYLTRKPNVIERYLPEWKRLVLSRIKSLTPIYKRNNTPGVPPGRVEYIANQWYPGEINRALLYSRMGFDEDSGTPAGDEYDAINKELLHELSEYEENMVYMLEADGRIKIEENPYGQEYITVIPESDEPTFTGMYPLVKKEGRLTRRQLRRLVNEVFIKPDPMRRWGPLQLPPYQPGMPISKGEYDALADLYKAEPEMALSMADSIGLIPVHSSGMILAPTTDTTALTDDPESEPARQWMRDTHIGGNYDPADYPILGDDYVEQIRNYHKDPRAHLGVPINEVITRRQLRKLILQEMKPPWASPEAEKWGERARAINDHGVQQDLIDLEGAEEEVSARELALTLGSREGEWTTFGPQTSRNFSREKLRQFFVTNNIRSIRQAVKLGKLTGDVLFYQELMEYEDGWGNRKILIALTVSDDFSPFLYPHINKELRRGRNRAMVYGNRNDLTIEFEVPAHPKK